MRIKPFRIEAKYFTVCHGQTTQIFETAGHTQQSAGVQNSDQNSDVLKNGSLSIIISFKRQNEQ
jgi:hypothetical protein